MLTPLAPVDVRQHPRRAPLCPSGRLHGDGTSCPGGPDSLWRGLGGRARRVGARMFAHVLRQLCRGGRAGRSNRSVEEGEAEGTAPYFCLESGRNSTNRPLEATPGGCRSRASRIRKSRQFILCGHFASMLAELVDPA
jgi:hypothetical protein